MKVLVGIWLGVSTVITAGARRWLKTPWLRAVGGAFIWPTYGLLALGSRIRYGLRRRSLP